MQATITMDKFINLRDKRIATPLAGQMPPLTNHTRAPTKEHFGCAVRLCWQSVLFTAVAFL